LTRTAQAWGRVRIERMPGFSDARSDERPAGVIVQLVELVRVAMLAVDSANRAERDMLEPRHIGMARKFASARRLLPKAVLILQPVFRCWAGRCQTCQQPIDLDRLSLHPTRQNE
jgi:hypothetical protein